MIEIDENALRAINNARAFLAAMLAGGWERVCVTGREGDYFISRSAGVANPLLVPIDQTVATVSDTPLVSVNAPHVGTLAWIAAIDQTVTEGEVVARLVVLDESIEIPASCNGRVAGHATQVDDLVEFGAPLLVLAV